MAENSEIPESNMEILKEALRAQQAKLQKVYLELEEEREASSSAASEAMLKILRLQAEKAQVKMEASQYKREVEEKMCFVEESIAVFEDVMYQKEMDIANLEFQVQAYTSKLLSAGCNDLTIPEDMYPDTPDQLSETASFSKDQCSRRSLTSERSSLAPNLFQKRTGNSTGALGSYREQIRKLGDQVNKISDDRFSRRSQARNRIRSCSAPPPEADEQDSTPSKYDLPKVPKILVGNKAKSNSNSPANVKDFQS